MSETPVPADLLEKLAAHAARMERIADESEAVVTSDFNERDRDGRVEHVIHTVAHVRREGGHQTTEIVTATRDGKDNRADARKHAAQEDQKPRRRSPFATDNRQNYRFAIVGPDTSDPRLLRISVAPVDDHHASSEVLVGEAIVDPQSGESVRLSGHASKYPLFVEKIEVAFEYGTITPEGRMLSAMSMAFAGGFAFIHKQGDGHMTFVYRPRSAPSH